MSTTPPIDAGLVERVSKLEERIAKLEHDFATHTAELEEHNKPRSK